MVKTLNSTLLSVYQPFPSHFSEALFPYTDLLVLACRRNNGPKLKVLRATDKKLRT